MKNSSLTFLFESFCVIDDVIWMSARDFNGLFKGSLKDGTIEFIGCFPGEHPLQKRLHYGEAICQDEKIYFVPLESKCMHVFNLRTKSFEKCHVEKETEMGYAKAVLFNDNLYMISTRKTELLRYDLKSKICTTIFESKADENYGYTHGTYVYGENIFLMLAGKNVMRCLNMRSSQVTDYPVGEASKQYQIVAGKENILYFVNKKEPEIFSWNILLEREQKRTVMEYGITLNSWQRGNLVLGNAHLGEGITVLDIVQLKTSKLHMDDINIPKKKDVFEVQTAFTYGQDLYFVWEKDGAIYSLNKKEKIIQFILTEELLQKVRTEVTRYIGDYKRNMFEEISVFQLPDFLRCLDTFRQTGKQEQNTCSNQNGKSIFRRMSDE